MNIAWWHRFSAPTGESSISPTSRSVLQPDRISGRRPWSHRSRGTGAVLTGGGPSLNGQLATSGLPGELCLASAPELVAKRAHARELTRRYNTTSPRERGARRRLLTELLATVGEDVEVEPPFHCDYGTQLVIGAGVYINVGCVVLDCA